MALYLTNGFAIDCTTDDLKAFPTRVVVDKSRIAAIHQRIAALSPLTTVNDLAVESALAARCLMEEQSCENHSK